MKKVIVLVSMLFVSVAFLSACNKKEEKKASADDQQCAQMYEKFVSCAKEMALDESMKPSKDDFVAKCKAGEVAFKCLDKASCVDFAKCMGKEPVNADKPADDMAAADMPADDMAAADMPADDMAAADMPAADMPADMQ